MPTDLPGNTQEEQESLVVSLSWKSETHSGERALAPATAAAWGCDLAALRVAGEPPGVQGWARPGCSHSLCTQLKIRVSLPGPPGRDRTYKECSRARLTCGPLAGPVLRTLSLPALTAQPLRGEEEERLDAPHPYCILGSTPHLWTTGLHWRREFTESPLRNDRVRTHKRSSPPPPLIWSSWHREAGHGLSSSLKLKPLTGAPWLSSTELSTDHPEMTLEKRVCIIEVTSQTEKRTVPLPSSVV